MPMPIPLKRNGFLREIHLVRLLALLTHMASWVSSWEAFREPEDRILGLPFSRENSQDHPWEGKVLKIIILESVVIITDIMTSAFLIITANHLVGETRPREDKMPRPEGEIIPRGRDMPVGDRDQNHD